MEEQRDAYELGEHILIPLIGRVENQGIGGEGIHHQLHQLKAVRGPVAAPGTVDG